MLYIAYDKVYSVVGCENSYMTVYNEKDGDKDGTIRKILTGTSCQIVGDCDV